MMGVGYSNRDLAGDSKSGSSTAPGDSKSDPNLPVTDIAREASCLRRAVDSCIALKIGVGTVLLVLVIGLGMSLLLYFLLSAADKASARKDFQLGCRMCVHRMPYADFLVLLCVPDHIALTTQDQLSQALLTQNSFAALFAGVGNSLTNDQFLAFYNQVAQVASVDSSGTIAVGIADVLHDQTEQMAWQAKHNKTIATIDTVTGSSVPPTRDPPYVALVFSPFRTSSSSSQSSSISPVYCVVASHTAWLRGRELLSSVFGSDILLALKSGSSVSTLPRFIIAMNATGLITCTPVYNATTYHRATSAAIATGNQTYVHEVRLTQAIGLVVGSVRPTDLLNRVVAAVPNSRIAISLYDSTAPAERVFINSQSVEYDVSPSEAYSDFFTLNRRNYELVCVPAASRFNKTHLPIVACLSALLFFLFVSLLLSLSLLSRHRTLAQNHQLQTAVEAKRAAIRMLAEARKDADSANQSKSAFMSYLCHELRNPLHAILSSLEFLEPASASSACGASVPLPPPSNAFNKDTRCTDLETIRSSASMMSMLLNDVLDIAKIEAGKMTFESITFDIRLLIEQITQLIKVNAAAKGLKLLIAIDPSVPQSLIGDPHRLKQALVNLLTNSLKFTEKGHLAITISDRKRFTLDDQRGVVPPTRSGEIVELRFVVEDTGIGMNADVLLHLFEPFTQATSSTARVYGGSGLGLSIVRAIVEGLGGSITVESKVGVGTAFTIELVLPIAPIAQTPIESKRDAHGIPSLDGRGGPSPDRVTIGDRDSATSSLSAVSLSKPIVLVVDDSEINRKILVRMLQPDYEVLTACNGLECIELIANKHIKPQLILMDLMMPLLDGIATTQRLRSMGIGTPIIALTANAWNEARQNCIAAGMSAFLSKPFGRKDIVDVISSCLTSGVVAASPTSAVVDIPPTAAPSHSHRVLPLQS